MKIYRKAQFDGGGMKKELNTWMSTMQNKFPEDPDFAVDLRGKSKSIPNPIRSKINSALHALGNYHKKIPLDEISNILEQNSVIMIQEDGTKWSGFVTSQGECGSEKANNQGPMQFELAIETELGYIVAKNHLVMTVCTMPSGNLEVVCYVS